MSRKYLLKFESDWPEIESVIGKDEKQEQAISQMLAQMTLAEKIGQMVQPELYSITPEEAQEYKIGSILNGAGVWPKDNKYCTAKDWAGTIDQYWQALEAAYADRPFRIPLLWATDAVHGHNNVYGSTLFPHNIGLGATRDVDLIERIGVATAKEISATGIDWTFAPTVTVPRDYRWGRHYEGYSEDPEIVAEFAHAMVSGLQGNLSESYQVLANVKHWVGDGGTTKGVDRGINQYKEIDLINIHGPGYFSALTAGAQIVMTSFNSWQNPANYDLRVLNPTKAVPHHNNYNFKIHGSKYLNSDVLKDKMGFDGVLVTDWDGHAEVTDAELGNANFSVLSGVDIVMVAARRDWQSVYSNLLQAASVGDIPMARIDDAVSRVLRVKMRAGLWQKPAPLARSVVKQNLLGNFQSLAIEAVEKSLVLLKNNDKTLPLSKDASLLLAGSGADHIGKQTGGWSLSWQGDDNSVTDFPGAKTLLGALEERLGKNLETIPKISDDWKESGVGKVAIVAVGEDPYAELRGDIQPWRSLAYSELKAEYQQDLDTIRRLKTAGYTVVTVLFSGRPLYINEELQLSDAFVVAWLPGPYAQGIANVLFSENLDQLDFQGRLSFSWPNTKRSFAINRSPIHMADYQVPETEQSPQGEHAPLFPYGYGLTMKSAEPNDYLKRLVLDNRDYDSPVAEVTAENQIFPSPHYSLRIAGRSNWMGQEVTGAEVVQVGGSGELLSAEPGDTVARLKFFGHDFLLAFQHRVEQVQDFRAYLESNSVISVRIKLREQPRESVWLATHRDFPSQPALNIQPQLQQLSLNEWHHLKIPLADLANIGCDFQFVSAPFMLFSTAKFEFEIKQVSWELGGSGK